MSSAPEWMNLGVGKHRLECPACGRGPKDRTLGVTVEYGGSGVAHCFRCEHVEHYRERREGALLPSGGKQIIRTSTAQTAAQTPAQTPAQTSKVRPHSDRQHATLSEYGRSVWSACKPVSGDALAYLEARRCAIPPADGDLRYHPALKHPTGYVGPALVALVTDILTGESISLHRTWVESTGKKAVCDPPRMLLGGHRKAGGAIRLWPGDSVTMGLGVAEGVETALSLALGFTPAWSCIDAGNLAAFPVLEGIESLLIAADHDDAGISAANACAARWATAARDVRIIMPDEAKTDLNDLAAAA